MFEMLVGRPPFQGVNFAQLFEQHLRSPAPRVRDFVSDVPEVMDSIVDQLLQKSPDDRPFNARYVQGVMIELLDSPQAKQMIGHRSIGFDDNFDAKSQFQTCSLDVGADHTVDVGQNLLRKRLYSATESPPRSWRAVLTLAAIGIAIVVLSVLVQSLKSATS
jgi:serine/threonine protein kinase